MTSPFTLPGRAPVRAMTGVCAAAHPMAAAAGAEMMATGGNAFDAVIAAAATLNVVEPFMSGLAGNGLAACWDAKAKRVRTLDFTPPVPKAFSAEGLVKKDIESGPKSPGIPGNLAGWAALHDAYGSKPLSELFAPAIRHARAGFPVSDFYVDMTRMGIDKGFVDRFGPSWRETYLDPLGELGVGRVLKQPLLAETLERIASDGPGLLYGGALGQAVADHLASLGGFVSMADLEAPPAHWVEPLTTDYRDLRVHTSPPPAESFQMLLTLRLLDGFDIGSMEHCGPDHLDIVFRAIRMAAELRITNNRSTREHVEMLMDDEHVAWFRDRLRAPGPLVGRTEQWGPGPMAETDWIKEHTTSFSAADKDGNLVCVTQTLGGMFGSGVVIPGTGVCLSNYLNWGDLEPDSPNFLEAGRPWASVVAPTIATRDGVGVLALGTPGSYGIPQTQAQAYVHHVDFGLDPQAAIDAPRARLWPGRRVAVENRVAEETRAELARRGHEVEALPPLHMSCGGMQAVARDPIAGALTGAADPRRDGAAVPA